jgi:hypothetical protein
MLKGKARITAVNLKGKARITAVNWLSHTPRDVPAKNFRTALAS